MTVRLKNSGGESADATPSLTETQAQLRRITGSEIFLNSPSQTALLEELVELHLNKTPIKGDAIGGRVFPGFIPARSSDVRVHARNLRGSLAEYYAGEGQFDPVRMNVLKGRNHRLIVEYNSDAEPVRCYTKALRQLRSSQFPNTLKDAIDAITEGMNSNTRFVPIVALGAEVQLLLGASWFNSSAKTFIEARTLADMALEANDSLWRAHVADGACHMCEWRWGSAARAFEKALALSPSETETDVWYLFFLVATDRLDEAVRIAKRHSEESEETAIWRAISGLILYAGRRFHEANDQLFEAHGTNPFAYLPRLLLGLWALAGDGGKGGEGQVGWSQIKELAETGFLGFNFVDPYPGLTVLFLANQVNYEKAREELARLEHEEAASSENRQWAWDLAVAYMAMGEFNQAIAKLKRLAELRHPLLVWLHLWPFFDPIRDELGFKALISEMGLPANR
jgi:tetratricopeptide (TPR) repeat protein